MKKLTHIFFAASAIAVCCGCSAGLSREFRLLESRVDENPDSVLAVIDSTAAVRKLDRPSSARLALIRAMAIDKSFGSVTSDDIRQAAEYYRMPWRKREKMLTLFYQGCALYNEGDYPQATVCYTKAQNLAESLGDDMLAALARQSRQMTTFVSISLILSLICLTVFLMLLKNQKIQKLETEKEAILSVAENERNEFSRLKKKLFYNGQSKFCVLRKLCDDYVMLRDDRFREQFAKEKIIPLLDSVKNERGENNELEKLINQEMDGLMSKLRADMRNFTDEDFRLLCYVIAGFDASLIARLMDKSKGDVYSRKHRLTQRILSSDNGHNELYRAVFLR